MGPSPSPKRGRAPSPTLRVEVENFEIEPEVGALPVIVSRFRNGGDITD